MTCDTKPAFRESFVTVSTELHRMKLSRVLKPSGRETVRVCKPNVDSLRLGAGVRELAFGCWVQRAGNRIHGRVRVSNFGSQVLGFGFLVSGFGFRFVVRSFGFRISGYVFRASGFEFELRISGFKFRVRVSGIEFQIRVRVSSFGYQISGFGCRVQVVNTLARSPLTVISTNLLGVEGLEFRVEDLELRVKGSECGVYDL